MHTRQFNQYRPVPMVPGPPESRPCFEPTIGLQKLQVYANFASCLALHFRPFAVELVQFSLKLTHKRWLRTVSRRCHNSECTGVLKIPLTLLRQSALVGKALERSTLYTKWGLKVVSVVVFEQNAAKLLERGCFLVACCFYAGKV